MSESPSRDAEGAVITAALEASCPEGLKIAAVKHNADGSVDVKYKADK